MNVTAAGYQAQSVFRYTLKASLQKVSFTGAAAQVSEPEEEAAEEDFEDMYYRTDYVRACSGEELTERTGQEQHIRVSLGKNELPEFMDMVREGLENGKSLRDVCKEQNVKAARRSPFMCCANDLTRGVDCSEADLFVIDTDTGEVTYAYEKLRGTVRRHVDYEGVKRDEKTVRNIADDLYTFLRYAAFPREEDDPERVERLFAHIKENQLSYSVTRFAECFAPSRDGKPQDFFLDEITAAEDEEKNRAEKEAIDDFIETLRVHQEKLNAQSQDRVTVGKLEEMESITDGNEKDDKLTKIANEYIRKAV